VGDLSLSALYSITLSSTKMNPHNDATYRKLFLAPPCIPRRRTISNTYTRDDGVGDWEEFYVPLDTLFNVIHHSMTVRYKKQITQKN